MAHTQTLTVLDARRIQEYVFASNRLADIVSGSFLIEDGLAEGPLRGIARDSGGELIYAAAGNAWARFPTPGAAREFAGRASRAVYDVLPGLDLAACHVEYSAGGLGGAFRRAGADLSRAKLAPPSAAALLGLSTTARCGETGLPAVALARTKGGDLRPRSAALLARDSVKSGRMEEPPSPLALPREFDDLGRTYGDTSQIALIHLDGNGIGDAILQGLPTGGDEAVAGWLRLVSSGLRQAGQRAWQAARKLCIESVRPGPGQGYKLISKGGCAFDLVDNCLPVRRLLLGGDDLTFASDGRIGLALAATALGAFGDLPVEGIGRISACAGVSIVGSHYPVFRALELARGECLAAKRRRIETKHSGAVLSWRVGEHLPAVSCRPYALTDSDRLDWGWFTGELLGTGKDGLRGELWREARGKVKSLAGLAGQPQVLEQSVRAWRIARPGLRFPQPLRDDGRSPRDEAPLLDAVELSDLYWDLSGEELR